MRSTRRSLHRRWSPSSKTSGCASPVSRQLLRSSPTAVLREHRDRAAVRRRLVRHELLVGELLDVDPVAEQVRDPLAPRRRFEILVLHARLEVCLLDHLLPLVAEHFEPVNRGGEQRQRHPARELPLRQPALRADDDGLLVERGVPVPLTLVELGREDLALHRAEPVRLQMSPPVEPHVVERHAQRRVVEELRDAADVIGVDVRDDQQVEMALARRQLSDALPDEAGGLAHAGVDQDAVRAALPSRTR